MTEWSRRHPIATHLINLAITVLLMFVLFCIWKEYYGDMIIETNKNTNTIMKIIKEL